MILKSSECRANLWNVISHSQGISQVRLILMLLLSLLALSGCASQQKLFAAAEDDDWKTAAKMVEAGMNPYLPNDAGDSPVKLALESESDAMRAWAEGQVKRSESRAREILQQIESRRISVGEFEIELGKYDFYNDAPCDGGGNRLSNILAQRPEYLEYLEVLIRFGAGVDRANSDGWTPLMNAVNSGNLPAVRTLAAAGANLEATTEEGWTALHFTVQPSKNSDRLHDAEVVKLLVSVGADLNAQNIYGQTPLFLSIENQREEMRKFLMSSGANPDIATHSGWTPLMRAVFDGNLPAARALVSAKANLEARNREGWTALHLIANLPNNGNRSQDVALARLLIDGGVNLNARQHKGKTPLYLSVVNNRGEVRDVLLASGANPNIASNGELTPLLMAVYYGNLPAVQALLAAGADVEAKTDKGWSVLHYVANGAEEGDRSQDVVMTHLLVDAGAGVNVRDQYGFTPLFLSVANNRKEVRSVLLASGANPNIANSDGCTPLMRAVFDRSLSAAQALVAANANPAMTDKAGWTALRFAGSDVGKDDRSQAEALERLLIATGADPIRSSDRHQAHPNPNGCR